MTFHSESEHSPINAITHSLNHYLRASSPSHLLLSLPLPHNFSFSSTQSLSIFLLKLSLYSLIINRSCLSQTLLLKNSNHLSLLLINVTLSYSLLVLESLNNLITLIEISVIQHCPPRSPPPLLTSSPLLISSLLHPISSQILLRLSA